MILKIINLKYIRNKKNNFKRMSLSRGNYLVEEIGHNKDPYL